MKAKYFALFLDFAMCNHNAVLVKMLRNATGHRALLPTTGADAMAKIVDAVRRSPDDYFQVTYTIESLISLESTLASLYLIQNLIGMIIWGLKWHFSHANRWRRWGCWPT